jgi:hypothetical protein
LDNLDDAKALLKYAMGCFDCNSTAPTPFPEASHSISNGTLKLGRAKTGAVVTATFNFSKASAAAAFQLKPSFFVNFVKGLTIFP